MQSNTLSNDFLFPVNSGETNQPDSLIAKNSNKERGLTMIYWLLIVNAFVDATMYFFKKEDGGLTVFSIARLLFYVVLIGYFVYTQKKIKLNLPGKVLILFLIYIFILLPFSSDFLDSLDSYVKVVFSTSLFIIGGNIITKLEHLKKINTALIISAIIISLQIVLSNVFGIKNEGLNSYNDELVTVGGGLVENAKSLCFILLSLLVVYTIQVGKKTMFLKYLLPVVIVISTVAMLLYFNRSAMFGTIAGYLVIFFFQKKKKNAFKVILGLLVALPVIFTVLEPIIIPLYEERIKERDLTKEGRADETNIVWGHLMDLPIEEILFGKEMFNSHKIKFGGDLYHGRQLHVDYNVLLNGSGVLGLSLYLSILIAMVVYFNRYKKWLKKEPLYIVFRQVLFAMIIASLIISLGGGIESIGFRSIFFLYAGGILSLVQIMANEKREMLSSPEDHQHEISD